VDKDTLDSLQATADKYNFQFSRLQVASANIPNGHGSIVAYSWMVGYFAMIGDIEPAKKYYYFILCIPNTFVF
jgi:hypothetical protein